MDVNEPNVRYDIFCWTMDICLDDVYEAHDVREIDKILKDLASNIILNVEDLEEQDVLKELDYIESANGNKKVINYIKKLLKYHPIL